MHAHKTLEHAVAALILALLLIFASTAASADTPRPINEAQAAHLRLTA